MTLSGHWRYYYRRNFCVLIPLLVDDPLWEGKFNLQDKDFGLNPSFSG